MTDNENIRKIENKEKNFSEHTKIISDKIEQINKREKGLEKNIEDINKKIEQLKIDKQNGLIKYDYYNKQMGSLLFERYKFNNLIKTLKNTLGK
ncbi:MAG: hypothetical protein Q9M97_00650 [Candidatus Gracilibacteria bacterium]|nr:hypothetical protein [Candidatus Gracilibacteria bacterium]